MNEANLLTVSFGAALALTLGVGAVLYYRQREWPLEARLLLALCPTLALVAGVNVLGRILFAPFEASMNNVHLAPTFGLRYGYHLYYPPGEGPIFNPMYPPP